MKYALDTDIFIDSFRHDEAGFLAFLEWALPLTFMSAVVMQELAAGARTSEQARDLKRLIFAPFERRQRVFAPSIGAFVKSGRMLADVAAREGWDLVRENPSLLNDALIAASCRERGVTLITRDGDFDRFLPLLGGWRHVAPWPSPSR